MENKMNDLVNREQVLEICRCFPIGTYRNEPIYDSSLSAAMDRISDLPAVIPEPQWIPVVHGRWIEKIGRAKCSVCLDECWADSAMDYKFCPNCGAKMDAERSTDGNL